MSGCECPREADVLDAVAAGRCDRDAEIAAHLAACSVCADLALVAAALREDHDEAWTEIQPPSSDLVWWRAQLRARTEAAQAAARPVAIAQGVGLAFAVAALVGVAIAFGDAWTSAWTGVTSGAAALAARVPVSVDGASFLLRGTVLAMLVWVALIPVAVWLWDE
jgi:hypothetical protein